MTVPDRSLRHMLVDKKSLSDDRLFLFTTQSAGFLSEVQAYT